MASEATLDFEKLLTPISEELPTGPELRSAEAPELKNLFYELRHARTTAADAERQLAEYVSLNEADRENEPAPVPPDWRRLRDGAIEALSDKTKDLWVAAWLIEALGRLNGFAGLRDGFRLVRELSERFWDGIHPLPDEDGIATTVSQLDGLNNALPRAIDQIAITPQTSSFYSFSSADYLDAKALEKSGPEYRAERIEAGAVTVEMFDRAAAEAGGEHFENLLEDLDACIQEFKQLDTVLEEKCGLNEDGYSAAPMTSGITTALEECRNRVRHLARNFIAVEEPNDGEAGTDLVASGDQTGGPGVAEGAVRTREDAFRALLKVSDFFRRTEPHSPVSYALEQAVRWGRMSLPELIKELVSDSSTRDELYRRTGVPDPDRSSEYEE